MIKFNFKSIKEEYIKNDSKDILYLESQSDVVEFFENVILVDSIVLKEEKESLLFYSLLSEGEKKTFNISSYFDSIDTAYNYYRLIKELYYNNISYEMLELEKWQEKYMKAIYNIHNKMIEKKNKENIMPTYLIFHDYKINSEYIKRYKKIVFVNKMYTNKKELEVLNKLDIEIEYLLFTDENDFNKEKMILENITVEKLDNKVSLNSFTDTKTMLLYLTEKLSKDNLDVHINDVNDKREYNEISCNLLNWHKKNYLNKSKSYKLLNSIYDIENSLDKKTKKIELQSIYFATLDEEFNSFFNISYDILEKVKKEYMSTKKYVDIDSYEFLEELLNYDVFKLCDDISKKYKDETDKFLEAVSEIYVLKDFSLLKYIDKKKDVYKLILKYLDAKKDSSKLKSEKYEILNPTNEKKENYFLLNAQANMDMNVREYILDANQRKKLNLKKANDFKYAKYYPFVRQMYLSNNVDILYIKNEENDIDIKSVFKSIFVENDVKEKNISYSSKEIKKHLMYISQDRNDVKENSDFLTENDYIKVEKEDFSDIKINGYSISSFMEDLMSYILKKYIDKNKLKYISIDDTSISNITIGNIIHEIVETALEEKVENIQDLKKIKEKVLNVYKDYIKKEYFGIYSVLLFDEVLEDVLKYVLKYRKYGVVCEKKLELDIDDNIKINYIIDTLFEKDNKYIVSDIKSGMNKNSIIYDYQVNLYKTFLEYSENKEVIDTLVYYPFDENKEVKTDKKEFTYSEFLERVNYVRGLDKIQIEKNVLEYNLKNIIRGVKSNES
ncbi:PD-(D/E)XK nuclease family protein [Oceanivirga miroungae]|uniref:Uncharacterized protein n=1 Tax=Oceanivirga miroungae TaxID=1130046 RepID=A0A6I8MAD4_9FUSO|nr:PD-(D/E)XK nuclease family protein [Oceanivirga miroungae]VWL85278.1 hypothetical protein OMES3154_00561 [Oceanivirga miroungae]